ncbi:hypothetical protein [Mycobacterium sp. MS1601]|uniref:hypothetical protein n=1 Tax=Mycobacterium sp. MS1601 TaxID=1936029 RepID=UPI00178C9F3F|nr:hypothetical protein [Mycobacterium sp. MS1601]
MGVTYLADHTLLLALPALLPAVIVAGVVVFIAVRDRRQGPDEHADNTESD